MHTTKPRQFVCIDAGVEDRQSLLSGISDDAVIHILSDASDGLQQVASLLAHEQNIAALHIISHGAPGKLFLGNSTLSSANLSRHNAALKTIAKAMSAAGELFLYGCEVAAGLSGRRFVSQLSAITGLKVAAATHKVGHADLGGSWELDAAQAMTSKALVVNEWQGVLGESVITSGSFAVTADQVYTRPFLPGDVSNLDADYEATWTTADIVAANTPANTGDYNYVTLTLNPAVTGTYTFEVTSATGMEYGDPAEGYSSDTQIWLYEGAFDPANPLSNVLYGNEDIDANFEDDGQNGLTSNLLSSLSGITLDSTKTYVLVVTTYDEGDTGTVDFSITGPGSVTYSGDTVLSPVTPYISGKEQIVIGENEDDTFTISGFTLGNANDADDTTTQLKVSITATHGTLSLGTLVGISTGANSGLEKTIEFYGTIADLRNAINTLSYNPDDSNTAADPLDIKISADNGTTWKPYTVDVPGKFYYAPNGHYYEYISAQGISWEDAKAAAEARTLYGLKGYLVTVTSQAESDFITPKLGGDGWMGASDAEAEGVWKWVTGPESGTAFYTGYLDAGTDSYDSSVEGYGSIVNVAVGGNYANWADGEPNNADWNGGEDYAHFYANGDWNRSAGQWNDYAGGNSEIQGYIVEYGGTGSDEYGTLESAKLTIVTNLAPLVTVTTSDISLTESVAQSTPQLIASDVTFAEDDYTLNFSGLYDNDGNRVTGKLNITFVDDTDNDLWLGNEWLSFATQDDISIKPGNGDGEIYYQDRYIGYLFSNMSGLVVMFDTTDSVPAAAVEALIQSLSYQVDDAPSAATKIKIVVTDNTGQPSAPAYVNVTVEAENDAPVLSTSTGLLRSNVIQDDWDNAYSVATLANGSIIVAGASYGDRDSVVLSKYDAGGVLDTTFGTNGLITIAVDDSVDYPNVAIDSNGKIIVAFTDEVQDPDNCCNSTYSVGVMRYNADGSIDTTFGDSAAGNIVYIHIPDTQYYDSVRVAVCADNSLALSFSYQNSNWEPADFAVAKLTDAGTLDTAFGTNGVTLVDINSGSHDEAHNLVINAAGNIVLVGTTEDTNTGTSSIALAVLNSSTGEVISTQTTGVVSGDVWSALDTEAEGYAVAVQSDGKTVVAGTADWDGIILARYNTDGSLDTSFGTDGKVALASDIMYAASAVLIDADDNILVLNDGDIAVARFTANGTLDSTFGNNGITVVSGSYNPWASSMRLATDGTIWIVGGDDDGEDGTFNIAKLNANGIPDATFGSRAVFTTYGPPVALDPAITLFDGELSNYYNYDNNGASFDGTTLTLARQGGANTNDVFAAVDGGDLQLLDDGTVSVYDDYNTGDYVDVGTYTQADGVLTISFNSNACQPDDSYSLVNQVMRNISYSFADSSIVNPTDINLVWTFDDGNTGDQGTGGAKSATLVQTLHVVIGEPPPPPPAPLFQSAAVDGTTLTLTYDGDLNSSLPAASAFTLKVNGRVVANGISAVALNSGDQTKLDLTLANSVYFGQSVTISYADPTAGDDANAIQNMAGSDAVSLIDYGVSNATAATSSVTIGSQMQGRFVNLSVVGGYSINQATNSAAPTTLGKSIKMPLGQFGFNITGIQNGGTAQLSMTADADLKQLTYYKYNYLTQKWTNIAKNVVVNQGSNTATVSFELTDGGAYDADRTVNGTIVDPGGLAENKLLPVMYENETVVGTISALNADQLDGTLSYAITGGADADLFTVDSSTGELQFKVAPDYETPGDVGDTAGNNSYAVNVSITGSNGGSEIQPLIVTVMNIAEAGDPSVGSNVTSNEGVLELYPVDTGGNVDTTTDTDVDGVSSLDEAGVPTLSSATGDGNGDGTSDNQQADVTSVPFRETDQISQDQAAPATYVTLVADSLNGAIDTTDNNSARITSIAQQDAPSDLPAGLDMPLGLVSFTADIQTAGLTETFSLFIDSSLSVNGYWKQNADDVWCNIATEIVDLGNGRTRIDFAITDGGEFDEDALANGTIVDPGAVGSMPLSSVGATPDRVGGGTGGFWF